MNLIMNNGLWILLIVLGLSALFVGLTWGFFALISLLLLMIALVSLVYTKGKSINQPIFIVLVISAMVLILLSAFGFEIMPGQFEWVKQTILGV